MNSPTKVLADQPDGYNAADAVLSSVAEEAREGLAKAFLRRYSFHSSFAAGFHCRLVDQIMRDARQDLR